MLPRLTLNLESYCLSLPDLVSSKFLNLPPILTTLFFLVTPNVLGMDALPVCLCIVARMHFWCRIDSALRVPVGIVMHGCAF